MKVPRHKKAHEVAMGHRGSGDSDTQHRRIRHGRILGVLLKNRKPEGKASIYQMNWFQKIAYYAKQSFQTKEAVGWGDQRNSPRQGQVGTAFLAKTKGEKPCPKIEVGGD